MGKHAFKMGYDLLRHRNNSYTLSNGAGSFSFAGTNGLSANGSGISNTGGPSLAAFLVGSVSSYTVTTNLLSNLPRDWAHSLYFQDDWKVTPTLTANLGVRYLLESTPNNKHGQQSRFDPSGADNTVAGATGVIVHPTGSMYKRDWNNFQPRVGLAWHLAKSIVIRTGFALNTVDTRAASPPTDEFGSISSTQNQASGNYFPKFQISQGPAVPLVWPGIRADGSIPFSGSNYSSRNTTWVNPDRVNPYTMNWNFGIQYSLSNNYLLEASYTGDRGLKGTESWAMNAVSYDYAWNLLQTSPSTFSAMEGNSQAYKPYTNFGGITYQGQGSTSMYHAGTIKIEKRYSYGLSFMSYYTYSKNITTSSGSPFISRAMDRGRSGTDRTHQFNGSMNYEIPVGKGRHFMNRGGIWNMVFGGYDMVWTYSIGSGMPLTFSTSQSPNKYMPGNVAVRSNSRPNSTGQAAGLRDGWQDLGLDRWTAANQNKMIDSMSYFTYPLAYTQGNVGRSTMDSYRFIAANFSASKEVKIKERLTVQFRYDFQNPFKWYTWDAPNTAVNFVNPNSFGTVLTEGAGCAACLGGMPIQNLTLAVKW